MKTTIKICTGKNCSENFSKYIKTRLEADKEFYNYDENIEIVEVPCMGNCQNSPNIKIGDEIFEKQNPAKTSEIVRNLQKSEEKPEK